MIPVFFIFLIVTVAGFLGSLLGLGGGTITTPALTLLFYVNIWYAAGASIISMIVASNGAAITYPEDRLTNVCIDMFPETGTTSGVITGAFSSGMVDTRYPYLIFGLLMLYSAIMMLRKAGSNLPRGVVTYPAAERLRLNSSHCDRSPDQGVLYQAAGVYGGLGMMCVAGTISGLLGIGGDAFRVMGMDLFMELPMKVSSATNNFMVGVTAVASAGVYFFHGDINPDIMAPVTLGALMDAVVGTCVMQRMESRVIRLVFVPMLVIASVQMIVKGVLTG